MLNKAPIVTIYAFSVWLCLQGFPNADRSAGEPRPADVIGAAIMVAKIATGSTSKFKIQIWSGP